MNELVSLHSSLAASAAQVQYAHQQVIGKASPADVPLNENSRRNKGGGKGKLTNRKNPKNHYVAVGEDGSQDGGDGEMGEEGEEGEEQKPKKKQKKKAAAGAATRATPASRMARASAAIAATTTAGTPLPPAPNMAYAYEAPPPPPTYVDEGGYEQPYFPYENTTAPGYELYAPAPAQAPIAAPAEYGGMPGFYRPPPPQQWQPTPAEEPDYAADRYYAGYTGQAAPPFGQMPPGFPRPTTAGNGGYGDATNGAGGAYAPHLGAELPFASRPNSSHGAPRAGSPTDRPTLPPLSSLSRPGTAGGGGGNGLPNQSPTPGGSFALLGADMPFQMHVPGRPSSGRGASGSAVGGFGAPRLPSRSGGPLDLDSKFGSGPFGKNTYPRPRSQSGHPKESSERNSPEAGPFHFQPPPPRGAGNSTAEEHGDYGAGRPPSRRVSIAELCGQVEEKEAGK